MLKFHKNDTNFFCINCINFTERHAENLCLLTEYNLCIHFPNYVEIFTKVFEELVSH